jgi:predicted nuclease of restriction endonuclease-like (RecB) superfamily
MSLIDNTYYTVLDQLKAKITTAKSRAFTLVNYELLKLYWEIGAIILQKQNEHGWGTKIIDNLAKDLKIAFPDTKGFSIRNLKYMRSFAEAYPNFIFVQPSSAQLQNTENQITEIMQQVVAQINWSHHITILDKVKTPEERNFYINKAAKENWSKSVLSLQIDSNLYGRQGKALNNFSSTLLDVDSDLAHEMFKSPYIFDLLTLTEKLKEKDIEKALIQHLKSFMLELGLGFFFVGNQYSLSISGDDYFLDLLFYHHHLGCFVVFELKVGDFKPEYAGKLNFYVNAINKQVKRANDKPTIGILLCKTPNETVVKYSLQGIDTPIGVAEYQLRQSLPNEIKSEMPDIEQLEAEIDKEYEELKSPTNKKKDKIRELIKGLKIEPIKNKRTENYCKIIFEDVLLKLKENIESTLQNEISMFEKHSWGFGIDNTIPENPEMARVELEKKKEVGQMRLELHLSGFIPAGVKTFNLWNTMYIELRDYYYLIQKNASPDNQWYENVYHILPSQGEMNMIAEKFCDNILEDITHNLERIANLK